jgi:hypothetical protein
MRRRARIALVSVRADLGGEVDLDTALLCKCLRGDAEVEVVAWDDPDVAWSEFDLAVALSTWDYPERVQEFLAWVEQCSAATQLANPPILIKWNLNKGYLRELEDSGVAVVPTRFFPPGAEVDLPDDREFVIKPAIGVGSRYAARYCPESRAQATEHVRVLHDKRLTVMVQPYMNSIDEMGERALIFVKDTFMHAIHKDAVLKRGASFDSQRDPHPSAVPWSPTEPELALARKALASIPNPDELLHARVDLVQGDSGSPVIMELELIDPNLFLAANSGSVAMICRAITDRCRNRVSHRRGDAQW